MMQRCFRQSSPMLAVSTFLLITATAQATTFAVMVGYTPGSDVTQHSYIDLDQKEMETHLATPPNYAAAIDIYTNGANSGGYAQFTVSSLAAGLTKAATVVQTGNTGATGYVKSTAAAAATTVKVTYTSTCKEGGSSSPDTSGCFNANGTLTVGGVSIGSPSALTNKYRTLAGFSTAAQAKMAGQEYYAAYRAYYIQGDYAHQYVMAALNGNGILAGKPAVSRVECAKKGSAYQNVWMYVIREMEDAIMDCTSGCINCNDDPVHAWDEFVAFYAGSLEGVSGSTSGKLLYRLAEKRCTNFGTCTGAGGKAAVNADVVAQATLGKTALLDGRCVEVIPIKRRIAALMSVPMVQGSLRYAYKVDQLNGSHKEIAEGAAFSAAILPLVAQCNSSAAQLISNNMKIDSSAPMQAGFTAVKEAFEATYACMDITCADVGGLILEGTTYYPMASPCVDVVPGATQGNNQGVADSASGCYLSMVACLLVCYIVDLMK